MQYQDRRPRNIPILSNIAEPDALSLKETLAWAHARRTIVILALSWVRRPLFVHVFCTRWGPRIELNPLRRFIKAKLWMQFVV